MQNEKILWVDDEIEHLKPFIIFLKDRGYHVSTASNGHDAIALTLNEDFDLILLDEMMPGLDGLATLSEIKKINPSIPVVMVTKNEEEGLMDRAIASQIADYLIKPVKPSQIIMTIKKIFEADEIRRNQIGQEYSKFVAKLNQNMFNNPDWKDWINIYRDLCHWDLKTDEVSDPDLAHTHFLEKLNCNTEFCTYIENNYSKWLHSDERPIMSFDLLSEFIVNKFDDQALPVYFIILDCMRLDQYYSIEPFIKELFDVKLDFHYSILPTATPFSRNSIFSGMLPRDIAKQYPDYWSNSYEMDNSRNRNEHQLLDEHIKMLGYDLQPGSKYVKIFNVEEGSYVIRKIDSWANERLVVLVYNFLDLLAHHRSKDQILQETIPNEKALRAFTKHWFLHSTFYETLKMIAKKGGIIVLSTDHGSVKVNRATQIASDREASLTLRYKFGKNLSANNRHAFYLKNPAEFGLPSESIVDNYIFAKDDYYFVYPNSYHQYQKQFSGTFQHGGISMQEMILPVVTGYPKKQ